MISSREHSRFVLPLLLLFLLQSWLPAAEFDAAPAVSSTASREVTIWTGADQPWPQYGDNPTRNFTIPNHSPTGGHQLFELGTLSDPVINWATYDVDDYGVQSYGTAIADLSAQITRSDSALERCGAGNLFAVFTVERSSGSSNDWLVIIEAGLDKEAWRVDLGNTEDVKSTPAIVDIDGDGAVEIILAYDTSAGLTIDAWSPQLTCTDAGWSADGHSTELLWSYTDPDLEIGIGGNIANGNHEASTQALIADLQMDGAPELVISAVNPTTGNPTVLTLPLTAVAPSEPLWEIQLDYGTHPSDPTWVALDETTSAVLLTTIDQDNGNMWAWKLQGSTGSPDWNARSLSSEGESGVPQIRLPGPVIAQLDGDALPEVIFTAPGDWDGSATVDAASFHAWELTDGTEKWSFTASNGYADAPPTGVDADGDGMIDRVCWVTWWEEGFVNQDRHGRVGCHDVSQSDPTEIWLNEIEPSGGSPNEGVALSSPFALDIDGIGAPETILAYGEQLFAFDGEDGHTDVWNSPLDLERRTWAQPSVADLDGDGLLDLLIGDILVSQANVDIAPLLDSRGISFSPSVADPGENVVITAQFANQGTIATDGEPIDAVLYVDDVELGRFRVAEMQPGSPTGTASDSAFSVDWVAALGTHSVRLELDPNSNLTQARIDNDVDSVDFTVVEPYDLAISIPPSPFRIDPGAQMDLDISIQATGRRTGEWSLSIDSDGLPQNWSVSELVPAQNQAVSLDPNQDAWSPQLSAAVPASAEGSETGTFLLTMTLDEDPSINLSARIPIEVNRTRGLSLVGPDGSASSIGHGIEDEYATAWFQIENLGNAEERLTSLTWSSNDWEDEPRIYDDAGGPYFTLTLAPGEQRELYAKVMVPMDEPLGDIASSELSACIGTGEEFECQQIDFDFIKNNLAVTPPHIRSLPGVELSYMLQADSSGGDIVLDLADAGMMQPGWIWSVQGQATLNSTLLTIPQTVETASAWMNVSIDSQSPPQLHIMQTNAGSGVSLNLSAQILQNHAASIEVVDPATEPMIVDVETWSTFVVRAVNTGNAVDTFELSAEFNAAGDISEDPGVEFSIAQPNFDLAVDASVLPAIDYRLPAGTPAGEELVLRVKLTSLVDAELSESVDLRVSAKQDHNWSITNATTELITAEPGESVSLSFIATNSGNLADTLSWSSSTQVERIGSDSAAWSFAIDDASEQQVGQPVLVNITTIVPEDAWADSIAYYNLSLISDQESLAELSFSIHVARISGWSIDLSQSNLEVDATGSNITLAVYNAGNAIVAPILTPVMPSGWDGSNASLLGIIQPGQSISSSISVIPPEDGLAGEVGILTLIVEDGDTLAGRSDIEVPLRIASLHRTEVGGDVGYGASWVVTPQGGMPLAWITNTGNALSEIDIQIIPASGWTSEHPDSFYLAAGQTIGLPINLIPAADWDYSNFSQEITLTDPAGTIHVLSLNVHTLVGNQNLSWATSPVLVGIEGDSIPVMLYHESTTSNLSITLTSSGTDEFPDCDDSTGDCGDGLTYRTFVSQPALLAGSCSIQTASTSTLQASTDRDDEVTAMCTLAQTDEEVRWSISLSVDGVLLDSNSGIHQGNATTLNFSLDVWSLAAGSHDISIDLYDAQGRSIAVDRSQFSTPAIGWNIGISSVDESSDGMELTVNMRRSNYEQLLDVHCVLSASFSDWSQQWQIDMAGGTLAPTLSLPRPDIIDGAEISFKLGCDEPYSFDDDASDDSFTHTLSEQESIAEQALDWMWGVGAALLVLLVARILGLLQLAPRRPSESSENRPATKAASQQSSPEETASSTETSDVAAEEDIHLDLGEEEAIDDEIGETEQKESEIEDMDEIDEVVDVFDVDEETIQEEMADEPLAEEASADDIDSKIERMMSRERFGS